jgi:hypothetical protein
MILLAGYLWMSTLLRYILGRTPVDKIRKAYRVANGSTIDPMHRLEVLSPLKHSTLFPLFPMAKVDFLAVVPLYT